jgi:hypothetical protein
MLRRTIWVLTISCLVITMAALTAGAALPTMITFQGKIVDKATGDPYPAGSYQFKFAITNQSGSSVYWTNDGSVTIPPASSVTVNVKEGGLYSVKLGQSPFPLTSNVFCEHETTYLHIWFDDGSHGMQELTPAEQILPVAYSHKSQCSYDAEMLNGHDSSYYLGIESVDGVSNDGGDIDLIGAGIISITPNNAENKITISASGGQGDITAVYAENGLTETALSGDAHLNVGAGDGIDVLADAVAVDVTDFVGQGLIETSNDINVKFGGTGLANTVARSDHTHTGYVDLTSAQTITGTKTFSSASNSFTGSGASLTNLNASNITTGTLHTDRFSAYPDLVAEGKIGTGSSQVAAGNHTHTGYVDLTSTQTISGSKTFTKPVSASVSGYSYGFFGAYANNAGTAGSTDGSFSYPTGGTGVAGRSSSFGMYGKATASTGKGVIGVGNNLSSFYTPADGCGVSGNSTAHGLAGYAQSSSVSGTSGAYGSNYNCKAYGYLAYCGKLFGAGTFGVGGDGGYGGVFVSSDEGLTSPGLKVVGAVETNGGYATEIETPTGVANIWAISSPDMEVYFSGTSSLQEGESMVRFDRALQDIISPDAPIRVIATPTGECNGLMVSSRSKEGFTVRELMEGKSTSSFDWIVIARRKGFEKRPEVVTAVTASSIKSELDQLDVKTSTEETHDETVISQQLQQR